MRTSHSITDGVSYYGLVGVKSGKQRGGTCLLGCFERLGMVPDPKNERGRRVEPDEASKDKKSC